MKKLKAILKSKKFRIFAIVFAIILVIVILIGSAISKVSSAVNMAMSMVSVVEVEKRDLSETIAVSGTADGISATNVNSSAVAEFTAVNVAVGDVVNEGDIICTLDTTEIQKQIEQAQKAIDNEKNMTALTNKQNETNLANIKTDNQNSLNEAQRVIDRANTDYNDAVARLEADKNVLNSLDANDELYESKKEAIEEKIALDKQAVNSAATAIEDAQSAYNQTKTAGERAVEEAKNAIDMASYQTTDSDSATLLENLNKQLEDCTIKAPCTGVVTAVNIKVGDTNTPGAAIATIEDTSSLKITVSVDESDINKLEEGMPATVTTTATGDEQIEGTVSRVVKVKGTTAEEGGMAGYTVEVTISNPNILIGMTAKVKIVIAERGVQLAVPYDSIRYDENDKPYVLLSQANEAEDNSIAVRCDVEVGEEVDYYTEITGGKLKEGDKLVYDESINEGDTFISDDIFEMPEEE